MMTVICHSYTYGMFEIFVFVFILGMYKFAEMFSLVQLREKSEDLIKRSFHSVVKEEEFLDLDAASLAKIIDWEGLNLGRNQGTL